MRYYKRSNVLGSIIDRQVSNVGSHISYAIGSAVSDVARDALGKVADQVVENVTSDMKIEQEKKRMALEKKKKIENMVARCPYCTGPTTGKEYCEYCGSKLI